MSNGSFETVAAAQRRARKQLPKSVYWSIVPGSEQGATLTDNVAAFGELGFTPHAGGLPAKRGTWPRRCGPAAVHPGDLLSPTGVQAVHPAGEVAVAARRRAGAPRWGLELIRQQSRSKGGVAGQPQDLLPGVYWIAGRRPDGCAVERARAAGAAGLINQPWTGSSTAPGTGAARRIPERMDLATLVRYAAAGPDAAAVGAPTPGPSARRTCAVPNMVAGGPARAHVLRPAYAQWGRHPAADLGRRGAWLRQLWGGRSWSKGHHPHSTTPGGPSMLGERGLGVPIQAATTGRHPGHHRVLAAVAAAVGGQVEVAAGRRHPPAADVVKAVALGARAVMIGRAYLWGWRQRPRAGVEKRAGTPRGRHRLRAARPSARPDR